MRKILASFASAALALGTVAHADDRFPLPTDPVVAPTPAPKPSPTKLATKQVSVDELGVMLENLGYEVTPVKGEKGEIVGWDTKFQAEGMTIYARIEISPSGKFIWITGVLATLKTGEELPKDMFANLLGSNQNIGPAHVQWDAKNKMFLVALAVSNANFNPADLRAALNIYVNGMKQAVAVWHDTMKAAAVEKAKTNDTGSLVS